MATFIRFETAVPSSSSAERIRYITRPNAVLDRSAGLLLLRLPGEVTHDSSGRLYAFEMLCISLIAWAEVRQTAERCHSRRRGRFNDCRTHYLALLGFESAIPTRQALTLTQVWLDAVLPGVRAVAALHRDTAHPHVHVWCDARTAQGRKITLSARRWRQMDEVWNRLYCQEMGQPERVHLLKKWETERYKKERREGKVLPRPARVAEALLEAPSSNSETQPLYPSTRTLTPKEEILRDIPGRER